MNLGRVEVALLDELGETDTGHRDDLGVRGPFVLELMELLEPERRRGGHHEYVVMPRKERRGLERGLDADDGHVRILLAKVGCRGGRGRVAGNHDGLRALREEVVHDSLREGANLQTGLVAIGSVGGVPEEAETLVRKHGHEVAKHRNAAHTRIEHPYEVAVFHDFP